MNIILFALSLFCVSGVFLFAMTPFRLVLHEAASDSDVDAAALFQLTFLALPIFLLVPVTLFVVLCTLDFVGLLLGAVLGLCFWVYMFMQYLDERRERNLLPLVPAPRYQLWLQDLFIFLGVLSVFMSIAFASTRSNVYAEQDLLITALGGVPFLVAGLLLLLDVCRYSKQMQKPAARGWFLALALPFGLALPWLMVAWVAWRRTQSRRCLDRARVDHLMSVKNPLLVDAGIKVEAPPC